MNIHIEMLVGTLSTVSGVVEIDGQVSVVSKLTVLPSDSPSKRRDLLIDAALIEQGKEAIND
jgi:hypothetical protein